jgi:hypothetical protein
VLSIPPAVKLQGVAGEDRRALFEEGTDAFFVIVPAPNRDERAARRTTA